MAILIDGEVISAPRVMQPIAESAVINGNITKEEAERIVAGIKIR
jgi:preprotein translocase subunit SecD